MAGSAETPQTKTPGAASSREERRAAIPALDAFRPRGGPVRRSRTGRVRAGVLIAVHVVILAHIAHWKITGSSVTPVEPSEAMQTLELGYVNAGFVLFVTLLLLTLVLGRWFCGWACHLVAYQDLCAWLLARVGLRPRPVRSRVLVWVPLGAAFYMFFWPTLQRWLAGAPAPELQWHLTTADFWATFPGPAITALTFVVCGFLIVYWLGAKGFCTYGCPYGGLFALGDRVAPGRIRVTDDCEHCGHCTATCSSNVRIHEEVARYGMVVDPGCMKCMDCVNVCPKDALYYGFGKAAWPRRGAPPRKARSDFSWREEAAMVAVFFAAIYALRGLYAVVPLLLAIGGAAIAAVLAVTGWRLLRRRDIRFQSRTLKAGGRFTPWGLAAGAGIAAFFAFATHSAWVQHNTHAGSDLAHASAERGVEPRRRAELLGASLRHLEAASGWGLADDPRVERFLGLVLREQAVLEGPQASAKLAAAEQHLRRAIALRPGWPEASVPLTDLLMMRGARDEAESILRALADQYPGLVPAQQRLQMLERSR